MSSTDSTEIPLTSNVSKPEHQGTGRSRYTDYLVTTKYAKAESLVRRQYEDFEWMRQRLVEERAGIIVPVMPYDKKAVSNKTKFTDEYVQERTAALHRFLQRIMSHPDLVDAPSLLPFFTSSPTDWKKAKELARQQSSADSEASSAHGSDVDSDTLVISAEQTPPQKKQGLFGKWISAKKDQWALRNKNLVLEETPVESKRFEDMQEYAEHLETCVQILADDSKHLSETSKAQSDKLQSMGAVFSQLWGEHELSSTSSSTMYQTVGECWWSMHKIADEQFQFGRSQFEPPLEELLLDVKALKDALGARKKTVYEFTKLAQEQRKMQQQMDKLRGADLSQQGDQYLNLERELRSMDVLVEERRKVKDTITARLTQDIERFRLEWHERMRQVLESYHQAQDKFLQDHRAQWQKAMPTLQEMDSERANLPTGPKKKEAGPELKISYSTSGATASFGSDQQVADMISLSDAPAPAPPVMTSTSFDSVGLSEADDDAPMGGVAAPPPAAAPPAPPLSPPLSPIGAQVTSV